MKPPAVQDSGPAAGGAPALGRRRAAPAGRVAWLLLGFVLAGLAAGCLGKPDLGGTWACKSDRECPPGARCAAGVCRLPSADVLADGDTIGPPPDGGAELAEAGGGDAPLPDGGDTPAGDSETALADGGDAPDSPLPDGVPDGVPDTPVVPDVPPDAAADEPGPADLAPGDDAGDTPAPPDFGPPDAAEWPNGTPCTRDGDCASGNCRLSPLAGRFCVPAGALCATAEGGGLGLDEPVCAGSTRYNCAARDVFASAACYRDCGALWQPVDQCVAGACVPCPTVCAGHADCVTAAYCDVAGSCLADGGVGAPCVEAAACLSGNCRWAPNGDRFCVPPDVPCALGPAGGAALGTAVCLDDDVTTCVAADTWQPSDCAADCGPYPPVDGCTDGACTPCPTFCDDDLGCDPGGYCDGVQCRPDWALGAACERDAMCASATCRAAPGGGADCAPAGADCADGAGGGLIMGERVCFAGDSYLCTAPGTFAAESCAAVLGDCTVPGCDEASGACAGPPVADGTLCAAGQGACAAGACEPLPHAPPADLAWTPVGAGPRPGVPADCGTAHLPCNAGAFFFPWPPDTGQTECSDASGPVADGCPGPAGTPECADVAFCGQDGQYGHDVTVPGWADDRFELFEDPSGDAGRYVIDHWTGLGWAERACPEPGGSCVDAFGEHCRADNDGPDWAGALAYCACLATTGYAGRSDWRLPALYELAALSHYGRSEPATALPGMPALGVLWTATTLVSDPRAAWRVSFDYGFVAPADKAVASAARCVATLVDWPAPAARYYLSEPSDSERLLFDTRTGLLWQEAIAADLTWQAALAACEGSVSGGRSDWRVPNVFELWSLVDDTRVDPALDPQVFPGVPADPAWFWSASSFAVDPTLAWGVNFASGHVNLATKTTPHLLRCVALGP